MVAHKRGGTSQVKHDNVLTAKQAEFVIKELSAGYNMLNFHKENIKPNPPEETELDNAYQKTLIMGIENKVKQSDQEKSPAQMEEWSILSNHIKYITSDRSETFNNLCVDQLNYREDIDLYRELQEEELLNTDVNFGGSPDRLKAEYLDEL